jgi:hypothetical protein
VLLERWRSQREGEREEKRLNESKGKKIKKEKKKLLEAVRYK